MDKRIKSFVIRILRRASLKHWGRSGAYKAAFVRTEGRAHIVECAFCKGEFKRKEVQADHIESVVEITDDEYSIDKYVERLFVPVDGYQILCLDCHTQKTNIENSLRLEFQKNLLTKEEVFSKLDKDLKKLQKKRVSKKKRTKKKITKKKTIKPRIRKGTRTGKRIKNEE